MSKVLIRDGSFVIAFDTEEVASVKTFEDTVTLYGKEGFYWQINSVKNPRALDRLVEVLSDFFQPVATDDIEEGYSPDVIYRLEQPYISRPNLFKLSFPSQTELDFATELLSNETRFTFKPCDGELYAVLLIFAPFYAYEHENKQFLIDILGEPEND